jgi:hypothetical protein
MTMRLPRQMLVETRLGSHALADPAAETRSRLDAALARRDWGGRRVAVAVGSRGIDRIVPVVRAVVEALQAKGARPFLLPAMGSHGGGTAEGQVEVLAALGITEDAVGAPVLSSVETTELGEAPLGFRILTSRDALAADAIVLVNRVKPHTDFSSPSLGSGLLKMSAIGLGKPEGAFECHRAASRHGHEAVIRQAAPLVLAKLPPVLGVALVEDGRHRLARVEVLEGKELEAEEPELLRQAREWMPALPLPEIDVLILDEIGKNVSGAGMDTNIVGRGVDGLPRADRRSAVRILYVRGLTPESHGNAVGMGLADVVSSRLVGSVDTRSTYMNSLSAMTPAMARAPMHFETDALCLEAAFRLAGVTAESARLVRIRNTLALDRFVASAACAPAIEERDDLRVVVPPREWRLDASGDLDPADDLLSAAPA